MSDEKNEAVSPTTEVERFAAKNPKEILDIAAYEWKRADELDTALAAARAEVEQIRDLHRLASASCAQIERERDEARQQLAALSSANEGLRKAMEPFRKWAETYLHDSPDTARLDGCVNDWNVWVPDENSPTVGDLRSAAALLAAPALEPADERDKRIAELEAALKPFVEYVSTSRFEGSPDHWRVGFGELTAGSIIGKGPTPTLGDCRRAAELLNPTPQPRPE